MAKTKKELRQIVKDKAASGNFSLAQLKNTAAGQILGGRTVKSIFSKNQPVIDDDPSNIDDDTSDINKDSVYTDSSGAQYPWDKYRDLQIDLINLQGGYTLGAATIGANAQTSAAGIRADADKEVGRAYADAQKYAAALGLEGVKYGADKESEWRQAVANIEVKGKLDLQPIINAGLEKVAAIEAQASRDVAETTGKYSLESMKQRTAADKSIGKMQLAGSMYGLIGSVFG